MYGQLIDDCMAEWCVWSIGTFSAVQLCASHVPLCAGHAGGYGPVAYATLLSAHEEVGACWCDEAC